MGILIYLFVLFSSSSAFSEELETVNRASQAQEKDILQSLSPRQRKAFELADKLVSDFDKIDPKHRNYDLSRMQVILRNLGSIEYTIFSNGLSDGGASFGTHLSKESLRIFNRNIFFFFTHNFFLKNGDTVLTQNQLNRLDRARKITENLKEFASSNEGAKFHQLANIYNSDSYSIRKSLKHGIYNLHFEFMKFIPAIFLVRFATCFGTSMGSSMVNLLSFSGPAAMRASANDPACVQESIDMLKDPVFWIGFSSFVAGSRVATPALLQALKYMDPSYGKLSATMAKFVVPNLALAFGFLSDHVVKTLLHNKDIVQCATNIQPRSAEQLTAELDKQATPAMEGQDLIGLDYLATQKPDVNATCKRAFAFIKSNQFLGEELGVGAAGLITTAVTLSTLTKIVNLAKGATRLKNVSFAFTATGAGGLAYGIAHMTVFLGIFEIIGPVFTKAYHRNFTQDKTDLYQSLFRGQYEALDPNHLQLNSKQKCTKHYTGVDANGQAPRCTRIPLIAEMRTFHDYSRTWRTKAVMGDFHMSHGHWQKKLTSFFTNYFSARDQVQHLTRSREVMKSGSSDFVNAFIAVGRQDADKVLREIYPIPTDTNRIYNEIEAEAYRHYHELEYISPLADLELDDPTRIVFTIAYNVVDQTNNLKYHREGDPFYGINGEGNAPTLEEVNEVANDILTFLDHAPVKIENPLWTGPMQSQAIDMITVLDLPTEYKSYAYSLEGVRSLIMSDKLEDISMGLFLFRSWLPYMYGNLPRQDGRFNPEDGNQYNNQGLPEEQFALIQKISTALQYYEPFLPGEFIYIQSLVANRGDEKTAPMLAKKSPMDSQWTKVSHTLGTENLAAYTLTQLICGTHLGIMNEFFGDTDGFSLEFKFPQLLPDNLCLNLFYPGYANGVNHASPFRSTFLTKEGYRHGLHLGYINAPDDQQNSLLFVDEASAESWWNETVLTDALQRLKQMQIDYQAMVQEKFIPTLSKARAQEEAGWGSVFLQFLPFTSSKKFDEINDAAHHRTTTSHLTESLQNELHHYIQVAQKFLPANDSALQASFAGISECVSKLLESIPDKNYTVEKTKCDDRLAYAKQVLLSIVDGDKTRTLNAQEFSMLNNIDESTLEGNAEASQNIKTLILMELYTHIDILFSEIAMYNDMVNEYFDFNLEEEKEGEIQ